ncbi:formate/nitrite transporter family protein, partial [Aestuariimicrobium ganziense]|uniref:formate/nitrite transporter family protein n=1 Tax=Aestuariimicrobium ganziense TaxID=2773677 RepID=UPI0019428100
VTCKIHLAADGASGAPAEDALVAEARHTALTGAERLNRTWRALIVTGFFGGVDVGLGIMAMVLVKDATGSQILAGLAFGVGLIALKMAHSELFTEDFLLPINAIVAGQGTIVQLVRLWFVTLVTNLAGGWLFTWLLVAAFPRYHALFIATAQGYLAERPWPEALALAVLAGSTITLVTRMQQGTDNDLAGMVLALISGLLVVGLGMLHGALNSIIVFAALHAGWEATYADWLAWFAWVIPANALGGLVIITLPRLVRVGELLLAIRRGDLVLEPDVDEAGAEVR